MNNQTVQPETSISATYHMRGVTPERRAACAPRTSRGTGTSEASSPACAAGRRWNLSRLRPGLAPGGRSPAAAPAPPSWCSGKKAGPSTFRCACAAGHQIFPHPAKKQELLRHLGSGIHCITASLPSSWRSIKKPGPSTLRCACTLGGGNGVHRRRQRREACRLLAFFLLSS